MRKLLLCLSLLLKISYVFAQNIVNVYVWGGEIPNSVIQKFERESGIKVNFSTYDSNETMYTKLKSSKKVIYDVIIPSSYFVGRMQKQNLLERLNKSKLNNLKNINPIFSKNDYDPDNKYSVPLIWGVTGIFYNNRFIKDPPSTWSMFWDKRFKDELMLHDDSREVFAMALLSLGYNANDNNALHILKAFKHLQALIPNIKLFSNYATQAVMIDEDSQVGMAWNGDVFKSQAENAAIQFIYPKDGFIIWVDCLAIPRNAPHKDAAYKFINFLLEASSAATIAIEEGHPITNKAGIALLPANIRNNKTIYPSNNTLKRGQFQKDVGDNALALYNEYWQSLKLSM